MSAIYDDDRSQDGADDNFGNAERDGEWDCAFPGNCGMAFTGHLRDECHTPEMTAEYVSGE